MKCEDFEMFGLDAETGASANEAELAAAREHAVGCSRCAALLDSWLAAKAELSALRNSTEALQTPARVEMRLRQEFRTRHTSVPVRRATFVTAWALAAAVVLIASLGWWNWESARRRDDRRQPNQIAANIPDANSSTDLSSASDVTDDFTLLPGAVPADTDDSSVVRVRMQRATLGAWGLPVNEDSAGEWIQVDLLVGEDGLPEAVKLVE